LKTFEQIREAKKPQGKKVHSGTEKVRGKKIPYEVWKGSKGYTAYVDGDMLDTFKSEKDAVKGAQAILKDLAR
jgi:hypothetical protein|tara:strand:- start:465 stop:683 length:219 start_codon:yes stop_codon:yes gene_type:complete